MCGGSGGSKGGGGSGGGGFPSDAQLEKMSLDQLEALDKSNPSTMDKYMEMKYPNEKIKLGSDRFSEVFNEWNNSKENDLSGRLLRAIKAKRLVEDEHYAKVMRESAREAELRNRPRTPYKASKEQKQRQWRMDNPL